MLTKMKLKKGDTVIVNTGAEKGKKGTILDIDRKTGRDPMPREGRRKSGCSVDSLSG